MAMKVKAVEKPLKFDKNSAGVYRYYQPSHHLHSRHWPEGRTEEICRSPYWLQPYHIVAKGGDGGAVGDEDDGFLRVGGKEAGKEIALGGLVERAANLVEQEDVATMQQTTGYGNALCLSFAESPTPFTEFGAECIG